MSFHPLGARVISDGTNAFTRSRYLVPQMCKYEGFALFIDGDMVVDVDVNELWAYKASDKAVSVVKHDYTTKHPRKYIGTPMENDNKDYPRKNWSSVVLWNCGHPANRLLDEAYIAKTSSQVMHRFKWLNDSEIGDLSPGWNYLVGEDAPSSAHLYHYTLGVPGIKHYANDYGSWKWHQSLLRTLRCAGEDPVSMVTRAQGAVGDIE